MLKAIIYNLKWTAGLYLTNLSRISDFFYLYRCLCCHSCWWDNRYLWKPRTALVLRYYGNIYKKDSLNSEELARFGEFTTHSKGNMLVTNYKKKLFWARYDEAAGNKIVFQLK